MAASSSWDSNEGHSDGREYHCYARRRADGQSVPAFVEDSLDERMGRSLMKQSKSPSAPMQRTAAVGVHSTVSATALRPLIAALESCGVPRTSLLHAADLTDDMLAIPALRIPRPSLYKLCEIGLELGNDPAFGLHWAEQLPPRAFSPVADLVYYAANVRESMEALQTFHQLLADDINLRVVEAAAHVTFRCLPMVAVTLGAERLISELSMAALHRRIQAFGAGSHFLHASFSYAAPSYKPEYERIFTGRVRFDQQHTELVFAREVMDAASPHGDAELHDALSAFCERRHHAMNQSFSIASRVRHVLMQTAWPRRAEMASVARDLGLSARSLRRRLVSEGTCFADICDAALESAAKSCLVERGRSIQETAVELGFADKAAFHRAFKRWTGMTPGAFLRKPASNRSLQR
jgi:AraC-like DNA-binding protein